MDRIRFVIDGEVRTVERFDPTRTVLEYLRETEGRCGTKEGCAEGDCGACTVVLGEIDDRAGDGERVRYRAINSCIRFLPTIDGKELVTVESLRAGDALHPVQQAMVDAHASQCGFCTPGFVMSLFALYLNNPAPQREAVVESLSGNLCRCTGYRPIIDAGGGMASLPSPARWSREDAHSAARLQALIGLRREQGLTLPGYCAPRSLDELQAALALRPQALLLAGGTDVGLWVTKLLRDLPEIIYLGEVAELKRIENTAEGLRIGAAVALTDAWQALVAAHPPMAELAQRFASPPVRNSATLCGNLANGSPIGDAMPALIALGASLELRRGSVTRRLALQDFYLGYQKKDLATGELVAAVIVPAPVAGQRFACYKLSKRNEQDISAVCVAIAVDVSDDGRIRDVRIACGGMAATPKRAPGAEAALRGQAWSEASFMSAIAALDADFQPLSDMRASSAYRARAAGNLLRRFFLEHGSSAPAALRTQQAPAGVSA
ncbi:MAG: xdhA [Hydrocarboniphaga sp.]|uniref:xanthine dehydrogenase small subunit n=1 Tax=Hydrocarboniphaga sp. TaxID=2033016 RepID=UPI002608DF1A|nr:xanthine dehydrogenase small subunit [Hydrocarboniphaga sp.]MDB5971747.1 xdhA [Hydrocarboniphaga sp.]